MASFFKDKRGSTITEYALVASLISIFIAGSVQALSTTTGDGLYGRIKTGMEWVNQNTR